MKGIVCGISSNKVFCAVRTDLGYTVFEVRYGDISLGDEIIGDLDNHGDANLRNNSQGHAIEAYVQAIQATKQAAERLIQSH
jgi:hypothetical protein